MLDIGGKDAMYMKKKMEYKDEPMEVGERVNDFLPAPDKLVPKDNLVKVTLTLSRESILFFKKEAKINNVKYQRMIRGVVDGYVRKYSNKHIDTQ